MTTNSRGTPGSVLTRSVAAAALAGLGGVALGQSVQWTPVATTTPDAPPGGRGARMAYDSARHVLVYVGGEEGPCDMQSCRAQTWEFDGQAWTHVAVGAVGAPGPRWRTGFACAYDSARQVTVVFGGSQECSSHSCPGDDTWEWNGSSWTQRTGSTPGARAFVSMAYDSGRGVMVLFGGSNGAGIPVAGTWEWDGSVWTLRSTQGPSPRNSPVMAFDAARGVVVMHGGGTATFSPLSDTWEWDGTAWTQRAVSGPPAGVDGAMAYDPLLAQCVYYPRFADETWGWDGAAWARLPGPGPGARYGHTMAYNTDRSACMLVGGALQNNTPLRDTWVMNRRCFADFNGDGDVGTDADIEAFFACLGGNCCATCPVDGDFNGDGDIGTDGDIEAFFRVLGGGPCKA